MNLTSRRRQAVELRMMGCEVQQVGKSMGITYSSAQALMNLLAENMPRHGRIGIMLLWLQSIPREEQEAFYQRCACMVEVVTFSRRAFTERRLAEELARCEATDVSRDYFAKKLYVSPAAISRASSRLARSLGLPCKLAIVWFVFWGAAKAQDG